MKSDVNVFGKWDAIVKTQRSVNFGFPDKTSFSIGEPFLNIGHRPSSDAWMEYEIRERRKILEKKNWYRVLRGKEVGNIFSGEKSQDLI